MTFSKYYNCIRISGILYVYLILIITFVLLRSNRMKITYKDYSNIDLQKTEQKFSINNYLSDYETKKYRNVDKRNWTTVYGSRPSLLNGSSILENENIRKRRPFRLDYSVNHSSNSRDDTQPVLLGQVIFNGQVLNRYSSPTYGIYLGTQPIPEPTNSRSSSTQSPSSTMTPITTLPSPVIPQQMTISSMPTTKVFDYSVIPILLAVIKYGLINLKAISLLKQTFFFLFKFKLLLKVLTFKFLLLLNLLFFKVSILPIFILLVLLKQRY